MLMKSALRDWLSVSYSMISILVISHYARHQRGENTEMVREVYDSLFFSSDPSFPLEGKSREAGKGVQGRASK